MKIHTKKKLYQAFCKKMAKDGFANDVDGRFIQRSGLKDSSMRRDYYPQTKA